MKTLNFEKTSSIFENFVLSSEEMINVRGGEVGEPTILPPAPPIKI
jgi:hypothetical protein